MNIKDMVSDNKQVEFVRYQSGDLWYRTECGFEFPVPVDDTGSAVFLNKDKALLLMRYIRKHIKVIQEEKNV